jgi:PKD repeat protein
VGACGGDNGPSNSAPTAKFSISCTLLACTFTDASTDSDGSVASYEWNFGESGSGSNTSTEQSPAHTYAAAGAYHVTLKVTDDKGLASSVADSLVNVSSTPANTNPTADFSFSCSSLDCTFTDQSTDPDLSGAVVSWAWDFGDGGTSTAQNPTHSYTVTAPDTFTVTLVATDNAGGTGSKSKDVIVAPPASCEGAACNLTLPSDAKVTVTLTSVGCTAAGNTLRITSPVDTTLFSDGCNTPEGTSYELGGAGHVFTAGATIVPQVTSGSQDLAFPPTLRLQTGSAFPTWVLEFDDGEGCGAADPTCGGTEPDFNDLIITITATP